MRSAGAGFGGCAPKCPATSCDPNRNRGRPQMHPENVALPGRTTGIPGAKGRRKMWWERRGEGTLKLNEKELLAKSKIKQTKRNKNFYSYIIINMELYIIIKRIVNCKQIISTVSGRDPAILLSYWQLLACLASRYLLTVPQSLGCPWMQYPIDQMEYQTYTVYNDNCNSS